MLNKNMVFILIMLAGAAFIAVYFNAGRNAERPVFLANTDKDGAGPVFPAPDKTRYQMQLYLDAGSRTLYGKTVLTTQNTSARELSELWFTSYPNCFKDSGTTPAPPEAYFAGFNQGWLQVNNCKINGSAVQINEKGACLQVKPSRPLSPGEAINIEMEWQEKIPRLKYRYGSDDTVYMLGNFYPALNVLSQEGWHNSYNSVFGDPFCFHSADYAVTLNVPGEYRIASTGSIVSRRAEDDGRDISYMEAQQARDFCLIIMYDYAQMERKKAGTTIRCFFPGHDDDDIETAGNILNETARILNYYSCQYGSYPYPEFKVVFVPMQGFHGMEYSGVIYLRDDFLREGYNEQQRKFILAHEIAHQWWYGLVGNDQLREPWLDEGLANWSAYQYLSEVEGQKIPAVNTDPRVDLGKELREMYSRQEYYNTAYSGGEAFWFGLEKELGHDVVIKVLRRYLADYKNNIATTRNLMDIIKIEARRDMDDYIRQWFPTGVK